MYDRSTTRSHAPGFTLIELLVVIAIIAILIGLLVPAIQKVRFSINQARVTKNLEELASAIVEYADQTSQLPTSFGQIGSAPVPPQIFPQGSAGGYDFVFTPGPALDFEIVATPAVVGVTGSHVCRVDQVERVTCTIAIGAAEGSAELQRKMQAALGLLLPYIEQDSLRKIGCVTELLGDGSVRRLIAKTADVAGTGAIAPQNLGQLNPLAMARSLTAGLFDASRAAACDGSVRTADDATLQQTLTQVKTDILAALQFGAGGEDTALLPAVRFAPDQGAARDFPYELSAFLATGSDEPTGAEIGIGGSAGLCAMVQALVSNPRRATSLCKMLLNVDKAALAGKTIKRDKLLTKFRGKLGKEVGRSLTDEDAALLGNLSYLL